MNPKSGRAVKTSGKLGQKILKEQQKILKEQQNAKKKTTYYV